ncbi:MAG TPA: carboxymuconolactone decarboxylase family protein [Nitrososphaera sp.]|nr:carboxymuconolactone decarboxylase family protein [Nitrososphaera sp.]
MIQSTKDTDAEIQETFGFVPGFFKNIPKDALDHMWPIFKKYQLGESVIPAKYREMIMLSAAAAIKCPYCEFYHREAALMMGASEEELAELSILVASTGFWSNVLHSMNYDKEKFKDEIRRGAEYMIANSKS